MSNLYRMTECVPDGDKYYGFFDSDKDAIKALVKEYKLYKKKMKGNNFTSYYTWIIQKLGSMKIGKIESDAPWKDIFTVVKGEYDEY